MMQIQGMFFDDNCVIMYENCFFIIRNFFLIVIWYYIEKKLYKFLLEYIDFDLK